MKYTNLILWTGLLGSAASNPACAANVELHAINVDALVHSRTAIVMDGRDGIPHELNEYNLNLKRWAAEFSIIKNIYSFMDNPSITSIEPAVPSAPKLSPSQGDIHAIEHFALEESAFQNKPNLLLAPKLKAIAGDVSVIEELVLDGNA